MSLFSSMHYRAVRSLNGLRASFQACGTVYITHDPQSIVRTWARNNPAQLAPNTKQFFYDYNYEQCLQNIIMQ